MINSLSPPPTTKRPAEENPRTHRPLPAIQTVVLPAGQGPEKLDETLSKPERHADG